MTKDPIEPRRAPHMERYTAITPYNTDEDPHGAQLHLRIGVQSFLISDGAGNFHENAAEVEWHRDMLCIALANLRNEVIEECALRLIGSGLPFSVSTIRALKSPEQHND